MKKVLLFSLLTAMSSFTYSEDIELYISDAVKQSAKKAKVLIIFDNSGSMTTTHTTQEKFDPSKEYAPEGSSHAYSDDAIYFNKGGADGTSTIPDSPSDARRFLGAINGCETAKEILATNGLYTGHIREYTMKGNTGSWEEIPDNNGLNIEVLDCEDDVRTFNDDGSVANTGSVLNADGLDDGYPVNFLGTKKDPKYHSLDVDDLNVNWTGSYVTLYTAKYLRWFHGQSVADVVESRMDTAINSINSVIISTPSIDFGLEVFNYNNKHLTEGANGGRIVSGIKVMTADNKAALLDLINNQLSPNTWTPLCESLYEASQYFAGEPVYFGDDDETIPSVYTANEPPQDTSVIDASNNYITPFDECSDKAHVILITDGKPTFDHKADNQIKAMKSMEETTDADGNTVLEEVSFSGEPYTEDGSNSYLPALAQWMNHQDINPHLEGKQTVSTTTIGFSSGADSAKELLKFTAAKENGGGSFYLAKTGLQLTEALSSSLRNLGSSNDSLTSASVAANNFDRTETLNSVYYAMFDPQNGPRWQGNLKKYKVIGGEQVGSNEVAAINEESGHFSTKVKSFWSSEVDGNEVAKGGVAEWFTTTEAEENRKVYTNVSDSGALVKYTKTNLETAFGGTEELATELGLAADAESADVLAMVNWALGHDVDDDDEDDSVTELRADTFGDPLHSKPLVVNYGDSIRIVIGTNAGALHMFEDSGDTVKENWAFMPKEFVKNTKALRNNNYGADKVYGIDGQITSHFKDINGDGYVNGNDKVYVFFGLRRGGSSYYGLDITNPDAAPTLLWHIDNTKSDFTELGQSWSKPKIGFSKLNISSGNAEPVLFFGGGYDTNKDSAGVGSADDVGRAVYMVDAKTGTLKWSMAPSGGTTVFPGTDSIPNSIATLDSDGDGLVDRLYAGDTGGNVWRVDMPSDSPTGDDPWTVFKLASLGSDTAGDNKNDRRFFSEPSIVRTFISETITTEVTDENGETKSIAVHQEIPYDAVLLGSGDRSNPLGVDTDDVFFMIKDKNIKTQSFTGDSTPVIPTALTLSDLYNYTENPFENTTKGTPEREILELAVSQKSGWFINLTQSGEKSSAAAIVINGVAYYTTFTPPEFGAELVKCKPPSGKGWLYAVDLALGTSIYNWKAEDADNRDDRIALISEQFLGAPTLIVIPEDDDDPETDDDAVGNIIVGRKIIPVGFNLQTLRTYLTVEENN